MPRSLLKQLDRLPQTLQRRTTSRWILGDGQGHLLVYDGNGTLIPGYNWARPASGDQTSMTARQIRNDSVAEQYGLRVIVGQDADGDLEVLKVDPRTARSFAGGRGMNVGPHVATHMMGGSDQLYVDGRLFMRFMGYPNNPPDESVRVFQTHYIFDGVPKVTPTTLVDFSADIPTGVNEQCIAIVCLDPATNTFEIVTSTPVTSFIPGGETMPFTQEDVAAVTVPQDLWRQFAVRLYTGQTRILQSDIISSLSQYGDSSAGANAIDHGNLLGLSDDDHTQYIINAPSTDARNVIQPTADTVKGLVLKQFSPTQSDNLLEVQDSTGTALSAIGPAGSVGIGGAVVAAQQLTVRTGADANKGIQIRRNSATQTANLLEATSSDGATVFVSVDGVGKILQSITTTTPASVNNAFGMTHVISAGATDISAAQRGIAVTVNVGGSGGATAAIVGNANTVNINQTAGTIASVIGFTGTLINTNAALITTAQPIRGSISVTGSGNITTGIAITAVAPTLSSTGVIVTNHGVQIQNQGATGITTSYGLRVLAQSGSGTNHAIHVASGLVTFNDDGADADTRAEGDNDPNLFFLDAGTDRGAFGRNDPATKLHLHLTDATTNVVTDLLTISHNGGSVAAGFGTAMVIKQESSTTVDTLIGRISYEWVVATHASRTGRAKFTVYDTAEREAIRIEASDSAPMIGFLGANAVARTSAYTPTNVTIDRSFDANATTLDELADVVGTMIADLQGFGLYG